MPHISGEDNVRDVLYNLSLEAVSRRYIDVCYCDMFSVVNVYLEKFYVVCINSPVLVNVMLSEMSPPPALCNIGAHDVKLCIFGVLALGVTWFPCMCVVNKQFELLEFVSESVDLHMMNFSHFYLGLCVCVVLAVLW